MTAEAWVAIVSVTVTLALAVVGGCGAWMMGVYRKLGAIEQGFKQFEDWMREARLDRDAIWSAHNALHTRVTRLEAQSDH